MDRITLVQDEPRGPSQLIEVLITADGRQRVPFPDVDQLRSTGTQRIIVKQIRLVTDIVLTNGPISGAVCAPLAELQKMTLVIYCEGWEKAQYLPLLFLNDMSDDSGSVHGYAPTNFDNWVSIDWSKTYIQYSNGTLSAGSPYCVMLDVVYVKLNNQGAQIIGPS